MLPPAHRIAVLGLAIASLAALVAGCATGDDGVIRRNGDGGPAGVDSGVRVDAQTPPPSCDPACPTGQSCRSGVCVTDAADADMDGVPAAEDCNDADPGVGRSGERACSSACGAGVESCTNGVWGTCSAPVTCDCTAGAPPRNVDCTRCGVQRQTCVEGMWMDDGACTGMGACEAGTTETETRDCAGGCGGTQTRTRTCLSSCAWGAFGAWTGTCPTCGPVCPDGSCDAGETCSACADCRYGHLGTGSGGTSCGGAPEGHWRCVTQAGLGVVSQVCRSGSWVNFNLNPMSCSACVCTFSTACCQPGSPSTGC